jgi:hypothetical protein
LIPTEAPVYKISKIVMANSKNSAKNLFIWAIVIGAVFAAVAFAYSMFLPKVSQVTGKIVIVPSGTSSTAGQNLYLEAGNTVEMINSPSFRKNILGEEATNFDRAESVKNSSTISIIFLTNEENVQSAEDTIAAFPEKIAGYARDLYGGSPFKYILISDPEVSAQSIRSEMARNVIWGFFIGFVLYLIYWLVLGSLKFPSWEKEIALNIDENAEPIIAPKIEAEKPRDSETNLPLMPKTPKMPEISKKEIVPEQIITPRDMKNIAPDNLPIADEAIPAPSDFSEPTDEEVKERLNRLMRGDL